jgi:predicted N-acetyltransferase YhbS
VATSITVRRLEPSDDRTAFRSGNIELDRFFHRFAGQNQFRHHLGTTFVALEDDVIIGYATVAASEIAVRTLPAAKRRRLPLYPLPILRLARLAVAESAAGRGVGSELLRAVFVVAHRMAEDLGCVGVLVDAKAGAEAFYERFGFFRLDVEAGELGERPAPKAMFLELGAIPAPMA